MVASGVIHENGRRDKSRSAIGVAAKGRRTQTSLAVALPATAILRIPSRRPTRKLHQRSRKLRTLNRRAIPCKHEARQFAALILRIPHHRSRRLRGCFASGYAPPDTKITRTFTKRTAAHQDTKGRVRISAGRQATPKEPLRAVRHGRSRKQQAAVNTTQQAKRQS